MSVIKVVCGNETSNLVAESGEELVFSQSCGLFGTCIDSVCVCDDGWSRSPEFDFFQPILNQRGLLCDTNKALLTALYAVFIVTGVGSIVWHLVNVKRLRRLNVIRISLSGIVLAVIYACLRVVDVDQRLYSVDVLSTLLYVLSLTLMYVATLIQIQTYIFLKQSHLEADEELIPHRMFWQKYFHRLFFVVGILAQIFYASLCFVSFEKQKAFVLVATVLWIAVLVYLLFGVRQLLGVLIKDIQKTILKHSSPVHNMNRRGSFGYTNKASRAVLLPKLEGVLPKLQQTKLITTLLTITSIFVLLPILFSATWMRACKYFIPIWQISTINSITMVRYLIDTKKRITGHSTDDSALENTFIE